MDHSGMFLAAVPVLAALFFALGHRRGWIMTALIEMAPACRRRNARLLPRREPGWKRI